MKQIKKTISILFLFALILSSCRKEEIILETEPDQTGVEISSTIVNLMKAVTMSDGSGDNILDNANCIIIQLPVTITANGVEIEVISEDDFDFIEDIFDEFSDDDDEIQFIFPIVIKLPDYSEIIINNENELDNFLINCNEENELDDDIECLDFVYPITATVFDVVTEQLDSITILNDNSMYSILDGLDDDKLINIKLPFSMFLFDGTEITVTSLMELENVINSNKDACDEDDDNDFDDDDVSLEQFTDIIADCGNWTVEDFEKNDNDLEDNFIGFYFNFNSDGTIDIQSDTENFSGNWSLIESEENIKLVINVLSFPVLNNNWIIHEIEEEEEEEESDQIVYIIELGIGDDCLSFKSSCN